MEKLFSLFEVENIEVLVHDSCLDVSLNYHNHCLLFKLFSQKFFNEEVFKSMMRKV